MNHAKAPGLTRYDTKALGSKRSKQQPVITWSPAVDYACRLDREADIELQAGHHVRAEFLARQAMALRGSV